ncbi:hypothetical protein PSTT_12304 [Puccinia striiformis]|uniref:Uncharacterized protein n=1 Tax=Puccinia striiformis TaxID=27350 RepID=A0A2S4UWQ0_9BASI|nr:hypothetical protein PSTT_12304 [Puccinia striiformis]
MVTHQAWKNSWNGCLVMKMMVINAGWAWTVGRGDSVPKSLRC